MAPEFHKDKIRLFYFASGQIAIAPLAALVAHPGIHVLGCVTQPDRRGGRKRALIQTPVCTYCRSHGIDPEQPLSVNDPAFIERLAAGRPHIIVVFAFGQILRRALLDLPPRSCMNIHASLLPKYRGASPLNAVILNGDPETGISYMEMNEGLDTGPIYRQYRCTVPAGVRDFELEATLATLAAETVCETVVEICSGDLAAAPQPTDSIRHATKIRKEDGRIDWHESAIEIERKVRAYYTWPGAWFTIASSRGTRKITVSEATVVPDNQPVAAGTLTAADKDAFIIACGENALALNKIIPEGKREMSGVEFLRGNPLQTGTNIIE